MVVVVGWVEVPPVMMGRLVGADPKGGWNLYKMQTEIETPTCCVGQEACGDDAREVVGAATCGTATTTHEGRHAFEEACY
jgi:hypothetical protein